MLTFTKAERKKAKLRMAVAGPSGSGKTYSSLLLASGLAPWEKVAVIDTENRSAELYSHLGGFFSAPLVAPFTPEKYVSAIREAEEAGFEVIIVDSLSHAWAGEGGMLETQTEWSERMKNSYTAWAKVTPSYNRLVESILQSKCHVIATMRSKTEYVLTPNERGKMEPKKIGMAPVMRDSISYEFTAILDIDGERHEAKADKDRTGLFVGKPPFIVNASTGRQLKDWLESGVEAAEECFRCLKKFGTVTPAIPGTKAETGYSLCESCLNIYREKNPKTA
jgi:hypothetical protein